MRIILILLFTTLLTGCLGSTGGVKTDQQQAEDNVKRDIVIIKVQENWLSAVKQCTPVKLPSCVLNAKTELAGRTALNSVVALRSQCLDTGDCDVCQIAQEISNVVTIIGKTTTLNVTAACNPDSQVDDILADLENMEITDVE